ncbi:MAG: hypothetical protein IJO32_03680 [Bacilli bacterium]|nr:hypothetical protein [Bacilli bacterium]
MKPEKIFKPILSILFIIFISLYISQSAGYYEYEQYKKVALTKEQIKEFERDIKEGKKVDIKDYVGQTKKEYGNKVSNVGLKLSETIEEYVQKIINSSFEAISDVVKEK